MIRVTLFEIGSFLLPFVLFMIWRRLSSRAPDAGRMPTLRLAAAGAASAIVMMLVLIVLDANRAGHAGERYVPPQNVDGRIIPGHFVPADDDVDEDDGDGGGGGDDEPSTGGGADDPQ